MQLVAVEGALPQEVGADLSALGTAALTKDGRKGGQTPGQGRDTVATSGERTIPTPSPASANAVAGAAVAHQNALQRDVGFAVAVALVDAVGQGGDVHADIKAATDHHDHLSINTSSMPLTPA